MTTERLVIVDGHEDLSMGALADGRDYLTSARTIREIEKDAGFENPNGICMLGLADWLAGQVAVVLTTVIAIPRERAHPGELSYATVEGAHQQALAHIDLYRRWAVTSPRIELVTERQQLDSVVASWAEASAQESRRIGLVLTMENADPIKSPEEVAFWAEQGIKIIGPAWHSNRYSGDTRDGGPLTALGRQLLTQMAALGLTLDLSHMSEEACLEALATYDGPAIASHGHSQRTAQRSRLLPDRVIQGIVARDGIVGVMPLNWALDATWEPSDGKQAVGIERVVDAIDTVCQIAGDAAHVGLGTDFDGGQGAESVPAELDTIADLPRLVPALSARGFTDADIVGVMGQNWLRFLRKHLPDS
jgi:membrane dipeptidase